ncbi:MAG: RrF2 family transcriptional regulator [Burkholderiaceae bacterium]|nr:RrF2 family transcriptional regulator [Burkholderiaceae bacterium]
MRVSTRGRYALRFLIDLAERESRGYISLKEVADRQSVSKKYLEQIVPVLNIAGLLKTNRGYRGGYTLARPASEITVADVLEATEGSLMPVPCLDNEVPGCENKRSCTTFSMWEGLGNVVKSYLSGVTIEDLVREERSKSYDDYCI